MSQISKMSSKKLLTLAREWDMYLYTKTVIKQAISIERTATRVSVSTMRTRCDNQTFYNINNLQDENPYYS